MRAELLGGVCPRCGRDRGRLILELEDRCQTWEGVYSQFPNVCFTSDPKNCIRSPTRKRFVVLVPPADGEYFLHLAKGRGWKVE